MLRQILRSEDGGVNWSLLYFDPERQQPIMDLLFIDADTGFAVGAGLFGWLAAATGLVPAVEGAGDMAAVWVVWGGAAAVAVVALAVARGLREG